MIFVTGAARSGTSLTAKVLQACGARIGRVNGLYEHVGVRDGLVKPFLANNGYDPLGQDPLPNPVDLPIPDDWRDKVDRKLVRANCYKGAKMALMWPVWVKHYPDAKWVLCRRDIDAIADSCMRCVFMKAYKTQEDWTQWAKHYINGLDGIKLSAHYIETWPDKAVKGDMGYLRRMVEFCGLDWNEAAVRDCINPAKWH